MKCTNACGAIGELVDRGDGLVSFPLDSEWFFDDAIPSRHGEDVPFCSQKCCLRYLGLLAPRRTP